MNKEYKSNSPYFEALGMRPYDKLYKTEDAFITKVFRYDRQRYHNVNEFADRYGYMENLYKEFCKNKRKKVSIRDFLEVNAKQDKYDVFSNISIFMKNNKIYFHWQRRDHEKNIHGTFQIEDYTFFATDEYLFFQHRRNGRTYIYRGEVY